MSEILFPLAVVALLILLNGLFVAAEFGIASAPRTRLQQYAEEGVAAARRALDILRTPRKLNRYISTAQIGITIASLGLGMYGEHTVAEWIVHPLEEVSGLSSTAAHAIATILAVGLLTYLHVVFGEMAPKSLALQHPVETTIRIERPMAISERLFLPLTVFLNWAGDMILRLIGLPPVSPAERLASSAELAYIVEESTARGLLDQTEQTYIENIFDFHERTVAQVMTPRSRMVAIPITADEREVLETLTRQPHSRYPVYEGDRDHIVGVLHAKDVARHIVNLPGAFDLRACMRPPLFVPETLSLEAMLQRFRREHVQIAIVLDEFGGTAGLVTMEDLVEEIVGEIQDEFDVEPAPLEVLDARHLRVRGDLLVEELAQHLGLEIEHPEAETVGGLIMAELGAVPSTGDQVRYANMIFTVEQMQGMAVTSVLVELPPKEAEGDKR
ncbi:hemolysin family protein [Caldilinea sp.]|uniref:hemolysin family protein n=1 Tax=Caldilinea sp. TaxID=2293560 RepID=UPI001B228B52|nr:hemolysin family protein [Caldilinea sp.]MBO9394181.1 HlyC/CorC family transporter [Caldilinea sp.]